MRNSTKHVINYNRITDFPFEETLYLFLSFLGSNVKGSVMFFPVNYESKSVTLRHYNYHLLAQSNKFMLIQNQNKKNYGT